MPKYSKLRVSLKTILAFFAATVLCAVFFAFPTSAVDWPAGGGGYGGEYVTLDVTNTSTGTIEVSDNTTFTVNGTATVTDNLEVKLMGSNSRLVWNATVISTHSINVTGAGASVTINPGVTLSGSGSTPTLNITATARTINISGNSGSSTNISQSGTASAISINSPGSAVTLNYVGVSAVNGSAAAVNIAAASRVSIIDSGFNGASSHTGSALVLGSTITNGTTITRCLISNISTTNPAVLSASSLTIDGESNMAISSSKNTAIRQEGGTLTVSDGTITGGDNGNTLRDNAVYGISASDATVILEGGAIDSISTDTVNNQDAAVIVTGTSNLTIRGDVEIDGGQVYGVKIVNTNSNLGIHTMSGGTVIGKNGIDADTASSLSLSGGNISANTYSVRTDAAVSIGGINTFSISGTVTIDGRDSDNSQSDLTDANGVLIHDTSNTPYCAFTMTGGTVSGESGFHLSGVGVTNISGGVINKTGSGSGAAILIGGNDRNYGIIAGDITISGNVGINGGTEYGVQIVDAWHDLTIPDPDPTLYIQGGTINGTKAGVSVDRTDPSINTSTMDTILNITGGTISGGTGVELLDILEASITGGNITATGSGADAGIYIKGTATTPPTTTIGGTVSVSGGTTADAIRIAHGDANVTITNGNFSGANGLMTGGFDTLTITGGTFSGIGTNGDGIYNSVNDNIKFKPTASTPITLKGVDEALSDSAGGVHILEDVVSYITSVNTSGSPQVGTNTATAPFVNSSTYKYVKFLATALVETPTTSPDPSPSPTPGYSSPAGSSGTDTDNPRVPIYTSESAHADYIIVIATLNKSGVVNSEKTAKDIRKAHNYARQIKVNKILLKITAEGTGVSKSAMQKLFKAANGTSLYLTFDFHTKVKEQVLGNVFVPLNSKSGQYLTRIYFDSKRIESVQKDIEKRWKTTILGSFETAEKGGWNEAATVTVNLNHLGFSADNNERLYALIYDTQTKKYYQAAALIKDGNVVITTKRSGIFTIVTDSIL